MAKSPLGLHMLLLPGGYLPLFNILNMSFLQRVTELLCDPILHPKGFSFSFHSANFLPLSCQFQVSDPEPHFSTVLNPLWSFYLFLYPWLRLHRCVQIGLTSPPWIEPLPKFHVKSRYWLCLLVLLPVGILGILYTQGMFCV